MKPPDEWRGVVSDLREPARLIFPARGVIADAIGRVGDDRIDATRRKLPRHLKTVTLNDCVGMK